jgi:hypothetical protein
MPRRITRKPTLPVKISYFLDLPGAVFYGDVDPWDIDHATRLQQISTEYVTRLEQISTARGTRLQRRTAREDAVWFLKLDLLEVGFDSSELDEFVTNPAEITNIGYYGAGSLSAMC